MIRKKYYLLLLPFILFLFACAALNPLPIEQMTPKQRAAYFMGVYNRQYEDYKAKAAMPDLTEGQKEILREKKKILKEIYPMIQTYDLIVSKSESIDLNNEEQIINMLTMLEKML